MPDLTIEDHRAIADDADTRYVRAMLQDRYRRDFGGVLA